VQCKESDIDMVHRRDGKPKADVGKKTTSIHHSQSNSKRSTLSASMQDFKVVVSGSSGEVPAELKNNGDGTII